MKIERRAASSYEKTGILPSLPYRTIADSMHPWRGRRALWLAAAGWSLFVALALWWILHGESGPSVWVVNEGGSQFESKPHEFSQKFHAGFLTELGLQRAYPWVLFGPYVALVAYCFPLERGRLGLNLPLNLAACAGFIATSGI